MEIVVVGWPARIAQLIKKDDAFGNGIVEKIEEGDEWFVVVHLREPVGENACPSGSLTGTDSTCH